LASNEKPVRSQDVAALAKASVATVSRVFSGDKRISEATRERVLRAAEALQYQPNLIARGLRNSSTGIVGVVVTDIDSSYHSRTLKLLIDAMAARSLAPLVFACHAAEGAQTAITRLMRYQVDAVIALAAPFTEAIVASCKAGNKPLVLMNRYEGSESVSVVEAGGRAGGVLAAEHLVACGGTRFAYLAGDDATRISDQREDGFREALGKLGHECRWRALTVYDYKAACRAAAELLAHKPDAVFCANDLLAFALMDVARHQAGHAIPRDLKVVGYDNSALCDWRSYNLTSIDQNLPALVSRTIDAVLSLSEPQAVPFHAAVPPILVPRGSTTTQPS
jgi:DNA-binding LacI/PurR family transcriptional regulator